MASYLHRTAQPFTLATFRSWGSSTGAGRIRLAAANIRSFFVYVYFFVDQHLIFMATVVATLRSTFYHWAALLHCL
jgi:hypothetical protein